MAFGKAVLAGMAGAVAWELVIRLLLLAGVPIHDITHLLGTLAVGQGPAWQWWPVGLALHAMVGTIWAVFYAYFFWSTFDWPPPLQGLCFALFVPTPLAGLIMVPQMALIHPLVANGRLPDPGPFGASFGWAGPLGLVLGHGIYGLVMGTLYTRPVGYPVRRSNRQRRALHG